MKFNLDDIYRLIDANINRSQEGIRVCEDICRFIINQSDFAASLKELRHKIFSVATKFSIKERMKARDVVNDDIKFKDTQNEKSRETLQVLISANIHRATEGLRSIEECSKLLEGTETSSLFQKIRFDLYELEKQIILEII